MEKRSKPEVRFKGFEEDWKEKKLIYLADFLKGKGYSKNDLTEFGTPIILYGRLYTNYQTVIKSVDTFVTAKKGNVFSQGGEVIVPASGETQEDIVRASVVAQKNIILGGDLNIITSNEELDSTFLALTISNGKVYNELVKKAQGKSVVHIRNNDLSEAPIPYPIKIEQQKIGNFFENLDQLITKHQQKHSKLKTLKKAMLSKMFPKQGQLVPEIRFKGFDGDWEEKALGDECEIVKGVQINVAKLAETGKYPVINGGITPSGYFNNWNTLENTITISEGGNSCGFVNFLETKFWSGGHCYTLEKLSDKVYTPFLFQELKSKQTKIMELRVGSGLPNIQKGAVNNLSIILPNSSEQKKIGDYFITFDKLIRNHQTQITKLQNLKKALLAKMFI